MRRTRSNPRRVIVGMVLLILAPPLHATARGEEPFRRTLISVGRNFSADPGVVGQGVILGRYATPACRVPWTVKSYLLHGGKQDGVDLVVIDNGKLKIAVVPTRGMGILWVLMDDVRVLGWDSPVREVVHPSFINLAGRGGLGWLEGFSEWLCRCGMEWNGHPGTDRFTNNVGETATMDLTLHGRVANLPAQEVEVVADREPPHRITLRARIDERMMHGPKLELETELSTEPGTSAFRIRDVVTNRGALTQEFQMLYHANFGPPLLGEGARFLAPLERVTPFNAHAAKSVQGYDRFAGPVPGFVEQVYCLLPRSDDKGFTLALIHNKAGDRAASIRFAPRELPYLTLWKNTMASEDGYVVGIEPGTNFPNNRRIERKLGRVPRLAPGASHAMTLDVTIHSGSAEVQQAAAEIAKIQGARKPILDDKPEARE